jgi:hypothetical protein
MATKRRSDILLGIAMVAIGLVPIGVVSFELLTGASVPTPVLTEDVWALEALWRVVGPICGLVLAVMGALTVKHGTDAERGDDTRLL